MKMWTTLAIVLGVGLSWTPAVSVGQSAEADPCDRGSQNHKLDLIADQDTKSITAVVKGDKDANELHVCRGDTVEWKLKGANGLEFYMDEFDDDPVLRLSKISKNGKLTTRVRNSAPRGKVVSYHVRLINGDPVEPIIIVD